MCLILEILRYSPAQFGMLTLGISPGLGFFTSSEKRSVVILLCIFKQYFAVHQKYGVLIIKSLSSYHRNLEICSLRIRICVLSYAFCSYYSRVMLINCKPLPYDNAYGGNFRYFNYTCIVLYFERLTSKDDILSYEACNRIQKAGKCHCSSTHPAKSPIN